MKIIYFKNKDIDKKRWDKAIDKALNGRIYGCSWYLDALCDNWDALIIGDYEYIMPFPWRSKYGIKYIYMPVFIQHIGIYAANEFDESLYIKFIQEIPKKFKLINLNINTNNFPSEENIKLKRRTNFILDIDRSYEEIKQGYSRSIKRILKTELKYTFRQSDDISSIIKNYQKLLNTKVYLKIAKNFELLNHAASIALQKGNLISCEVINDENEVLASSIFFTMRRRAYSIAGYQTEKGRSLNAKHHLIDSFFQTYCGKIKIFDFEGSDIPGVSTFFKKWGAVPEYYTNIQIKRFPVNLFK